MCKPTVPLFFLCPHLPAGAAPHRVSSSTRKGRGVFLYLCLGIESTSRDQQHHARSLLAAAPTAGAALEQLTKRYAPTRALTVPAHAVKQHTRLQPMAHVVKPQRAPACPSPAALSQAAASGQVLGAAAQHNPKHWDQNLKRGATTLPCCTPQSIGCLFFTDHETTGSDQYRVYPTMPMHPMQPGTEVGIREKRSKAAGAY
mmetsp:Transcript_30174/g.76906  ORF Transcript_30174/g.76906 Transcript_30174/m.76906 type:complete len:201 (-) Transcript_30174:4586-5188(-)